ncbi:hypothetical protein [Actinomycetospora sp. CA-053990]|uniref:hypothetical protein n=1 Tax=Actinomycetospora sp. CA-053990 TaxID=3239891 RepID=UPI003D93F22A
MVADPDVDGAGSAGLDGLARAYVRLALRLDRVVPGVLDAHLGDPAEAARVAAEPAPRPDDLARETGRLREALPSGGSRCAARSAFLDAQLRACRVLAERAGGREIGFVDEVERSYGVRIGRGEPDRYREAHRDLDALLGGPAPSPSAWRPSATAIASPPSTWRPPSPPRSGPCASAPRPPWGCRRART